ncbi:MAG: aminomethyl-transferring glycine dehydrogenase subunit GcvPA [Acidimicrobiales bacterium]
MAHPYMANSTADLRREMLSEVGASSVEELFAQIPAQHRLRRPIELAPQLASEAELRRHLLELVGKNSSCDEVLSFLGAGCYRHHVPALCDDVAARQEWLTSVWGTPSSDHGRFQAWFEFASELGELLDLDFVGLPVYSWGCAVGHGLRMAARLTGRRRVLVPKLLDSERRAVIANYCGNDQLAEHLELHSVAYRSIDAHLDIDDLRAKLDDQVAAVYVENPNFLGVVEDEIEEIVEAASAVGAEVILGVDPLSLGVLAPPGEIGVGLAVGTLQTLGVHMNAGGGIGGFIASRDEERYAREYPTLQVSMCETTEPGERGFGITLFGQTSYGAREQGNDWTGNSVYLWAIVGAAFMAAMGPAGFAEVGAAIVQRSHYAAARLAELSGVTIRYPRGFFKEFVVDFNATGRRVAQIDTALRRRGIFGGVDLSARLPEFGQSALYCVTELHTKSDIDRLADSLAEVLR